MAMQPFFIVGSGRSGSTLLQTLVDAHPHLSIPRESHIYDSFDRVFDSYGDLRERGNQKRFINALLDDVFIRQWRLEATVEQVERRLARPDRGGIIEALFALYAEQHGALRWGDKTPEHVRHLRDIRGDFPDAKLIHLVRDGRDVAEAFRRMVFGSYSAVGLARDWRRDVMAWQTFCLEHGKTDTLVVRYEDLVTNPATTMRKVFRFLDEPYVDTVPAYASTHLSRALSVARGDSHASLRQGISPAKIGVYRQKFAAREIEIFEAVAGDALAVYGYGRDCSAPRAVTARERLSGFVTDRVVRWYRKLHDPITIWMAVQRRLRFARRFARSGPVQQP